MEVKTVTNTIKTLRFNNNSMTQQELADIVGCTRQTIISIEQNRYNPSLSLAKKIAYIFNVSIDEVFNIEFE
ncbi:helix-turn-helix transcriptional regulator [Mycoplasmatota bacterium WC30]